MEDKNRESGYYWVKLKLKYGWEAFYYIKEIGKWWFAGNSYIESELYKINEERLKPPDEIT